MSEGRRLDAAAAQLKLGLSLTTHFALVLGAGASIEQCQWQSRLLVLTRVSPFLVLSVPLIDSEWKDLGKRMHCRPGIDNCRRHRPLSKRRDDMFFINLGGRRGTALASPAGCHPANPLSPDAFWHSVPHHPTRC